MEDIALFKSIYLNKQKGFHLQQYVLDGKESDLYRLDLVDFEVFKFSKYLDSDLLTLQFTKKELDELCKSWIEYCEMGQEK